MSSGVEGFVENSIAVVERIVLLWNTPKTTRFSSIHTKWINVETYCG
jgi:hypothetical protein